MFSNETKGIIIGGTIEAPFRLAGSQSIDGAGVPTQRFTKELMRVGEFHIDGGTRKLDIQLDDLNHWVKTFKAYVAAGNKVSMPSSHDAHGDPTKNMGWVTEMYVEDDKLIGVCDVIGKDSIEAAHKSDASVWAPPSYEDSQKNKFDWPIRHVAFTTDPQITGMGPFIPIAASNDAKPVDVPVFKPLRLGEHEKGDEGSGTGGSAIKELNRLQSGGMTLEEIGKRVSRSADTLSAILAGDIKNPPSGLVESLRKIPTPKKGVSMSNIIEQLNKRHGLKLSADAPIEDVMEAIDGLAKANGQEIKLTNNERHLSSRMLQQTITQLVKDSKLSSAAGEKILKHLSSDLMLSVRPGETVPAYEPILLAIAENNPVELGQQSQAQTDIELSRQNPGETVDEKSRQETQERMTKRSANPAKK